MFCLFWEAIIFLNENDPLFFSLHNLTHFVRPHSRAPDPRTLDPPPVRANRAHHQHHRVCSQPSRQQVQLCQVHSLVLFSQTKVLGTYLPADKLIIFHLVLFNFIDLMDRYGSKDCRLRIPHQMKSRFWLHSNSK